ncbi:MAG: ATP-binding protein [Myxococcota bacterium]
MSDISCRAFSWFLAAEQRGLVSLDRVLAGLPVSRAELEQPSNRVPWDVWAQLCDRFVEELGSEERLTECHPFVLTEGFAGYLSKAVGFMADTRQLYELAARWVGPSIYRPMTFSYEPGADGDIIWSVQLRPGFRPCRTWFVMVEGALARVPAYAGLPDALVERLELTDHGARFRIRPPASASLSSLVRRAVTAFRAPQAIFDELYTQQVQLNAAFDDTRRSEQSLRNVLAALPQLVAVHDGQQLLYANPAFAHAFAREGDLVGARVEAFFPRLPGAEPTRMTVRSGPVDIELEVRSVERVEFGGRTASLLVASDVSAERRAARSEATVAALLEAFPDLVMRFDRAQRLVDFHGGRALPDNSVVPGLVGRTADEICALYQGPDRAVVEQLAASLRELFLTARPSTRAVTLGHPQRELLVRYLPLGDEAMLVVHDETERKSVQRRLEIAERMASLGSLTAGVAHEVNNPLTWVLGSLETLDAELRADEPRLDVLRQLLADARDGATRIRDTVARMREFSRVQQRPRAPMSLAEVVQKAGRIAQHELRHVARLELDLPALPPVLGDATELGQVFVNLLVNAAQAMPEGASPDTHAVTVRLREQGAQLVATVTDTGLGIAPDVRLRIFDPFFTARPRGAGTGLGLAITHRIVESHGGTISVESTPGNTVFTVTLPAAPPEAAVSVPAPAAAPAVPGRARVLVIDDEPMVSRSIVRMLRDHEVTVAANVDEGLARLGELTPDLILCDLMMPGRTGMDFFEALSASHPQLLARVVFMTGGTFTPRAEQFLAGHDVRVVTKPFQGAALNTLAQDALRKRG